MIIVFFCFLEAPTSKLGKQVLLERAFLNKINKFYGLEKRFRFFPVVFFIACLISIYLEVCITGSQRVRGRRRRWP